ncbi:MAG: hypothetical protein LBG82_03470 [Clostridiales Family XIII bacterium]|nr:hypothetical protein [Clostridiales Family XIII bacterium]
MKISKTAISLFELMVVILIFSIAAAVCTNVFGKAYAISEESKALTMAVLKAESLAEEFKAGNAASGDDVYEALGMDSAAADAYRGGIYHSSGGVSVFFDSDWNAIPYTKPSTLVKSAHYVMDIDISERGGIRAMDIDIGSLSKLEPHRALTYGWTDADGTADGGTPPDESGAESGAESGVESGVEFGEIYKLQVKSYV